MLPIVTMVIGFGAMLRTFSKKKKTVESLADENTTADAAA
jgi:cytochrome c-type biogenesis protein CcmH/NrfF